MSRIKQYTKTLRLSVRLKGIGPKSKKKLMAIGLDENLTLATTDVEFKAPRRRGFDSPQFAIAVVEAQESVIKECVECVVEEI
jgi:hypothetical protein